MCGCLGSHYRSAEAFRALTPLKTGAYNQSLSLQEDISMYAVIRSGGKQYRVTPGQTIRLEKLAGDAGSKIELDNVLMVEDGGNVRVGSPLPSVKVAATILETDRANKFKAGENVGRGRDDTLFAKISGIVQFEDKGHTGRFINIQPL